MNRENMREVVFDLLLNAVDLAVKVLLVSVGASLIFCVGMTFGGIHQQEKDALRETLVKSEDGKVEEVYMPKANVHVTRTSSDAEYLVEIQRGEKTLIFRSRVTDFDSHGFCSQLSPDE